MTGAALLVLGLLYLAYQSDALAPFGLSSRSASSAGSVMNPSGLQSNVSLTAPPVGMQPSQGVTGVNSSQLGLTAATSVGTAALSTSKSFSALGLSGSAAGAALAGIGAVAAIAAALWAAHEQRVKQAKDENSATNNGVLGWDSGMRQINAAYNARHIDAASAISLMQQVMEAYWAEVVPHIQPGRNGCQNGASCPASANPNSSTSYATTAPATYCSGSIGAACCVGCADLQLSMTNAIVAIQHGGGPSFVQKVYPSKYGAVARESYTLNWQQLSAA